MPEVAEVLQLLSTSYASQSLPSIEATIETINFSVSSTSNLLATSHNNFTVHGQNGTHGVTFKIYLDGTLLAQAQNAPGQDAGGDDVFEDSVSFTVAHSGIASGNHSLTVSATVFGNTFETGSGSSSIVISSGM